MAVLFQIAILLLMSAPIAGQDLSIASAQRADSASKSLPEDRQIILQPGRRISSLLSSRDKHVTIVSDLPPPLLVDPPPGVSLAAWQTEQYQVVAVVRVIERVSSMTSGADWIMTTVKADVSELLKNATGRELPRPVSFLEPGGRSLVDGVTVTAVVPWLRSFQLDRDYLVFGVVNDDGSLVVPTQDAYELAPEGFTRMRNIPSMGRDSIESNTSIDEVLTAIRIRAMPRR